jgi:transcriptional regulator with GAF, ATPase, and Fis domain
VSAAQLKPELSDEVVPVPEPKPATRQKLEGKVAMRDFIREQQRAFIRQVLEENRGNLAATARALKMDRGNLHHLARRLGLLRPPGPDAQA